jgi:hypothetical protein
MQRLYRNIQHLYGETNRLRQQLEQLSFTDVPEGQIADTSNATARVAGDQQQSQHVIQQLRRRVHELEHSTSWRITAPVRALKRLVSGNQD